MSRQTGQTQENFAVTNLDEGFEYYADSVFKYLFYLSGDSPLAEDLTGETFLRAIIAIDGFRGDASLKTWLLRIARNLYLRRVKREKPMVSLEQLHAVGQEIAINPQPSAETEVLRQEQQRMAQQAMLSLSENDRSILILSSIEKLPYREIAKVLNISVPAVKVRVHRARQRLAAILQSEELRHD